MPVPVPAAELRVTGKHDVDLHNRRPDGLVDVRRALALVQKRHSRVIVFRGLLRSLCDLRDPAVAGVVVVIEGGDTGGRYRDGNGAARKPGRELS